MLKTDVYRSPFSGSATLFAVAMLHYYYRHLANAGVWVPRVASVSGYKRPFEKDKEYPPLIE